MKKIGFIIRERSVAHTPTPKEVRNWKENNNTNMANACPCLLFTTGLDFTSLQHQPCPDLEPMMPDGESVCVEPWAAESWDVLSSGGSLRLYLDFLFCSE